MVASLSGMVCSVSVVFLLTVASASAEAFQCSTGDGKLCQSDDPVLLQTGEHKRSSRVLAVKQTTNVTSLTNLSLGDFGRGIVPPDGKTVFGIIPQEGQLPSDIAQRMRSSGGLAPAGYTIFVRIPMQDGDRTNLQQFMEKTQGAIVVVSAEPKPDLNAVQAWHAEELAGYCQRYEENGGVGCILRFAHEMNGAWYSWGQKPGLYKEKFRMVAEKVRAVTTRSGSVWSINEGGGYPFTGGEHECKQGQPCFQELDTNHDGVLNKLDDPYDPYYPGDDLVDWVGITLYHWGHSYPWGENEMPENNLFVNRLRGHYNGAAGDLTSTPDFYWRYCDPAGAHNKPMILTETSALYTVDAPFGGQASNMDIKRNWWNQVFGIDSCAPSNLCGGSQFPMIKAIMWFDIIKEEQELKFNTADWSVTHHPDIRGAFLSDVLNQRGGRDRYMGVDELNALRGHGTSPRPSPHPSCSQDYIEDCRETKCCTSPASTCYEKDSTWAACSAQCTPGINPYEPEEHQTPWTCKVLR